MAKEQRVEIDISADGHNLKVDLIDFQGKECEVEMNHLANHLGLVDTKITKKPEYNENDRRLELENVQKQTS